jgi:hypothetical protein
MFVNNGNSKVGAMIVLGLMLGGSAGANARASDPPTSQARAVAAQQQADAARERAREFTRAGGWAYKSGLVQRAQRDAARYQEVADEALAEASSCPPPTALSPAQSVALARVEELRHAGGWAYKSGAIARAELDVRALAERREAKPVVLSAEQAAARARLEGLRQAGGWAYKTGAVARAERDVQALAKRQPKSICERR